MKFIRLSMTAMAVAGFTSSAVAMDLSSVTVKPYAQAKLYYEATDLNGTDMFDKKSASGQVLLTVGATGKLDSSWGYGFEYMVTDTLGLENNLVSAVRSDAGVDSDPLNTQDWASQAYVTYSPWDTVLSNTTFKIGRQFLDTPFAFTEKWNITRNSFDAVVVMNQDIKNVTLVGAYVGRGNGQFVSVTSADKFEGYPGNGIGAHQTYAVGALTKVLPELPINAWYYNIDNVADAAWVDGAYTYKMDADTNIDFGAQYGAVMPDAAGAGDTTGYGVKVGGKLGMFGLEAAYTSVDDDDGTAVVALANTATGFNKTKLYTATLYTDGTAVAIPGSDAWSVKATAKVNGIGKFIAKYNSCTNDDNNPMHNVDELDVILATKVAGINAKVIYMNRSVTEGKVADAGLKDDTNHLRFILAKNF